MKLTPAAMALILAAALPSIGQADPTEQSFTVQTTQALADLCADTSSTNMMMTTAAQNFCHGYMVGAYQILAQINAAHGKPIFCISNPPPSQNQAIAQFVSWVGANPTEGRRPPADGVYEFLAQNFPCGR